MHKYYYTYKITLLLGSLARHYYYGQHRTKNLGDGYTGSGKITNDYFKHYGKIEGVTYVKEILHFYNTLEELNQAEYELIGDKYDTDPMCLNIRAGGGQHGCSKELSEKLSKNHHNVSGENNPMYGKLGEENPNYGRKRTEETKRKMSVAVKGKQIWWKGKHHSEETKKKMSEHHRTNYKPLSEEHKLKISNALKGKYHRRLSEETKRKISEKRRQYNLNRVWINLDGKTKFVEKDNIQDWLDGGWVYGRGKTKKSKQNND